MPVYGSNKKRTMLRSVLPSTARKTVRADLATLKRKSRRALRQALHNVAVDIERWDEQAGFDDILYIPRRQYSDDYGFIVSERRGADNVAALLRWAPSQVKGVRLEDRLSKFRAMLPHNTIGRHAASHVKDLSEFYVRKPDDRSYGVYWWQLYDSSEKRAEKEFAAACNYAALEARLKLVLEDSSKHRRFNKMFKSRVRLTERCPDGYLITVGYESTGRPLLGVHDIEAFVAHHMKTHLRERGTELGTVITRALDKVLTVQ